MKIREFFQKMKTRKNAITPEFHIAIYHIEI